MMEEFLRRLRYYFRRREFEADLEEEMAHHASMTGRAQFGNITRLREESRAMWGWTMIEQFGQDLRYAFRAMANNRAFTALAILSLALGIGANTAIYSFMDSILLRSLPVQEPERLVVLKWVNPQTALTGKAKGKTKLKATTSGSYRDPRIGSIWSVFPYPAFVIFEKQNEVFSSVFGYLSAGMMRVTLQGEAALAQGVYVTGDYFRGSGVAPAAGRLLTADDDRFGAEPVAVVSAAYAQQRFGGIERAVGAEVGINGIRFTVAGVTPPGFFGMTPEWSPQLYIPVRTNVLLEVSDFGPPPAANYSDLTFNWIEVMGRLKPGVTQEQAQAALGPIYREYTVSNGGDAPVLMVNDGAKGLDSLRRQYSQPLYVLLTMVGLILAIACANIANLLLARSAARRREIAVRLSMGAARARIIRQLLTESVTLAALGGAIGVLFAVWGMRVLTVLLANGRENFTLRAELNWQVLGVTAGLALLTGLVFGLAPAIQATRVDVIPALKEVRAGGPRTRRRSNPFTLSRTLVVGQITLSLLLLVAAGLFVRTLSNLQAIELGFNRENILLLSINAQQGGYRGPALLNFYKDLQAKFGGIAGVRGVSLSSIGQLIGGGYRLPMAVPGSRAENVENAAAALPVGPDYLKTLGIPLVLGREIAERDTPVSQKVVVVSESFARLHFGGDSPLGRHIDIGPSTDWEIVGVAKDARYGSLRDPAQPLVYMAYNQSNFPPLAQMVFALRTAGAPEAQANAARQILRQADAGVPMGVVRTLAAQIDQGINQEIIFARLCSGFAALALLIACVGLYGTTAYNVVRRTGEIGIRMALGAQRNGVVWMVMREVVWLGLAGLAIGLPIAFVTSRFMASFLFGMEPNDPLALAGAVFVLLTAAAIAGFVPARRASRIDPMVALRHE